MLSNLFFSLLKINIMATVVALIVLILKFVLKRLGASRKLLFYLWIIIALRFVSPTFIESKFSLFNLIDTAVSEDNEVLTSQIEFNKTESFDADFNIEGDMSANIATNLEITDISQSTINEDVPLQVSKTDSKISEILMIIWGMGSLCMLIYASISYIKLKKTVMFATKGEGDYYETDMISTPCVVGIIKPRIYLTLDLSEKERKYILTHESVHIRRKDYISKVIAYLILSIHWINPACWVLFKTFVNDMEMLCDEESIKQLGSENKVGYMESLVNLASTNTRNILPCPIAFSENNTEKRVKNMIKYKKSGIIISVIALIICLIIAGVCLTNSNKHEIHSLLDTYPLTYDYLLNGKNGEVLFIDSISSEEYEEMMNLLYPNGILDEQGQEIGSTDNYEVVRAEYIKNHTKAYTKLDGRIVGVGLEPFYVTISDRSSEGEYEYLFYKAVVGDDKFIFPSEYGNQPFGFITASEKNMYIIYSDLGIWKINTENFHAEKLTNDDFEGESYTKIQDRFGGYLIWVDNAILSPNADYLVYRTNRDSIDINDTSVWKIDLNTGKEEQILAPNLNNNIIGFISNDAIVAGSTSNTRLVNTQTLEVYPINIPEKDNMSVVNVKEGKLIYSTYEDGSSITTYVINEVNLTNGSIAEIGTYKGIFTDVNTENIENLSRIDLIYLQNDVDNGHYSWRLKEKDVVNEYFYNIYGVARGMVSNIMSQNPYETTLYYSLNEEIYTISLSKLKKEDNTGIWFINDYKIKTENTPNNDINNQLSIIINNINLWKKDTEFEKYNYAATDLDQNGRLEIISSTCQGTGIYTYTEIYEVNENLDDLKLCESNLKEYDYSQADIIKENFIVYWDKINNRYHYIFEDLTKNGAAEYYENKRDFCLSDGKIHEEYLAYKTTIYENSNPTITYRDSYNKQINELEYNNIENKVFENLERMLVNIDWLSEEEITLERLKHSYDNFLIYKSNTIPTDNKSEAIYINAIKDLYYNYKLPDGSELEDPKYVEGYDMSENRFAIYDIDSDGKEELLIALTHYPMAAMRTIIYDYNPNTNKFRDQLTEFNWMNFYDNGILEAMWSHNQGAAGDALWPYTMYSYNKDIDSYEVIAQVDAWDKSFSEIGYTIEAYSKFPDEIDIDSDGILYYVIPEGNYELAELLDLKEYNEWRSQYITAENIKFEVPYMNFTEDNIK